MKKLLTYVIIALAQLFSGCSQAYAKDAALEVEFSFDPDYPVAEFRLLCETVPGSGEQVLVATTADIEVRAWEVMVIDIPPGRTLDWYISAVDQDGDETYSPAYQFKLTGKPTILRIKRR